MADDAADPEGELTESTGTELKASVTEPDESSESPHEAELDSDTEAAESDSDDLDDSDDLEDTDEALDAPTRTPMSHVKLATLLGLVLVLALGGLVGWLGWRAKESQHAEKQRELFLQVGRQAAINLTTIDFEDAEGSVQRILDSATDTFYDDFSKRSGPFTEVVKQAQSKSTGEVTAAGLESEDGQEAQVLVAVTVKTSNAGAPEQAPRLWRMRISVKNTAADEVKVSNVEFVP